jgi:hypothetical protein
VLSDSRRANTSETHSLPNRNADWPVLGVRKDNTTEASSVGLALAI